MSGDTKRVLEVNQIDNLQGSTQRVKQENTLNNLRGVTQRVYVVGGGGSAVINPLSVTPSTSAQTITASGGVDGYSPVNVSAVDSTIDANITAGNIKDGVSILGVTGNYQGNTPTGTMYIISNGTYNVADKAIANVNVPTTAPAVYKEYTIDANNKLLSPTVFRGIGNATDLGENVLYYEYYKNTSITGSIDLSSLITISGVNACSYAFCECTGITSVDLSSLTSARGASACKNMFQGCTGITTVDLSSLTTIFGANVCNAMFQGCTGITTVDLSSLTTITAISSSNAAGAANMFYGCTNLTSVDLSSLTSITTSQGLNSTFYNCTSLANMNFESLSSINQSFALGRLFYGCTNLTRVSFYALTPSSFGTQTNQFNNMLQNVTGCTVHFPIAIQSKIGSWADVTNGFGGTNTTVLFDIVTTLTGADSNSYTRKQKESTSTATAWTYNDTLYYTSGTTEPVVNDTIYSDAACTTAVTTISAIA